MQLRISTILGMMYAVALLTVCIPYISARWYAVIYMCRLLMGEL
jgi:hypothetical protein